MLEKVTTRRFAPILARCVGATIFSTLLVLAGGCGAFLDDDARIERAREATAAGDYRTARIEIKRVLGSAPDHAEARMASAEVSMAMGDAETAERDLRRAIAAGLPAERAAQLQGRVMLALGQAADLLQRLNDHSLPVQEPEWSVLKADALVAVGEAAGAEALYRSVLRDAPEHVHANVGLALAIAVQGDEQAALALLTGYLQAHPEAAEAWLLRGEILSRLSRYSEAESAFRQASSDNGVAMGLPRQLSALSGLADAQLVRGANGDARATLQRMRRLADGATQTRLIAARLALIDQDYAAAVAQLQPVARAAPNFVPARFLLGAALLAEGNVEQAESHLSAVVQTAPENVEARKLLAKVRIRLQRYDLAMQVLTPAMQDDAFDPELSSLLSEVKLQTGAQREGVEILEQSALRDPGNVGIKLDLSAAYIVTGRSAQAVEILRALPEVTGDHRREMLLVAALAAAKGPIEARREIERLAARYPEDVNILSLGAETALSQADYAVSRAYLESALAIEPSNPSLLGTLAQTEMRAGSLDAAEAALQRLLEVPGSRTAARLGFVEVARLRGNIVEARKGLEQIRAEDSAAVAPRLMLARLMLEATEAASAAKVLSEVVAIEPQNAKLRLDVARLMGEFGRYDDAMRQVRIAVETAPGAPEGWVELARMQLAIDQIHAARQSATKAVDLDRESVEAVGLLALLDLREKRGDSALNLVVNLAARRPSDPRAAVLEGDVRLALGQPREAVEAFERAMTLRSDLRVAARLSAAMRGAGMARPELPLARWVSERPGDARARTMLAEAYELTGRRELAIEQYERLAASPLAGFAVLNNLAWLYCETGDERAEVTARRAYDLAADNPAVADTYGWILTEKGKVAEGLAALEKAVKHAPDNPDIRYHYSAALARSGEAARAKSMLDNVLRSNPTFASRAGAEQLRRDLTAAQPAIAD